MVSAARQGAPGPAAEKRARRDGYLVRYELELCFDTDLEKSHYDHVATSARCSICKKRIRLDKSTRSVLVHARSHESELSIEPTASYETPAEDVPAGEEPVSFEQLLEA